MKGSAVRNTPCSATSCSRSEKTTAVNHRDHRDHRGDNREGHIRPSGYVQRSHESPAWVFSVVFSVVSVVSVVPAFGVVNPPAPAAQTVRAADAERPGCMSGHTPPARHTRHQNPGEI